MDLRQRAPVSSSASVTNSFILFAPLLKRGGMYPHSISFAEM